MIDSTNSNLFLQKLFGRLPLLLLFLQTQSLFLSFSSSLSLCLRSGLRFSLSFRSRPLLFLRCDFGCARFFSGVCTTALAASTPASLGAIPTGYTLGSFPTCAIATCTPAATACEPMSCVEVQNCAHP